MASLWRRVSERSDLGHESIGVPAPRSRIRSLARLALSRRSSRSRRFIDMKASIKTNIEPMTSTNPMKYKETELMQSGLTPAPVKGLAFEAHSALRECTRVMR